jgi:hypothetical protein
MMPLRGGLSLCPTRMISAERSDCGQHETILSCTSLDVSAAAVKTLTDCQVRADSQGVYHKVHPFRNDKSCHFAKEAAKNE